MAYVWAIYVGDQVVAADHLVLHFPKWHVLYLALGVQGRGQPGNDLTHVVPAVKYANTFAPDPWVIPFVSVPRFTVAGDVAGDDG
jgi:hypothetical protein